MNTHSRRRFIIGLTALVAWPLKMFGKAHKWMEGDIIRRCGGKPVGYFLPKKGLGDSDNIALALIGFKSLADYENYRGKLMDDSDARANLAEAEKSRCILSEERSYFYRIE